MHTYTHVHTHATAMLYLIALSNDKFDSELKYIQITIIEFKNRVIQINYFPMPIKNLENVNENINGFPRMM